jgi:SNF2-related domain
VGFATAILDEAQLIKNAESLRAKAACALDAKVRFALTGTPVENHIGDLYSIFRFLLPDLVGTWPAFNRRFGAARSGEAGNLARRSLKRLLKPYLLRRTKAQVLEELPPLTEIEHRVALSPAEVALYEGVRRKALEALEEGAKNPQARLRVLAEITRLRRPCCHPAARGAQCPRRQRQARRTDGAHCRATRWTAPRARIQPVRGRVDPGASSPRRAGHLLPVPRRLDAAPTSHKGDTERAIRLLETPIAGLSVHGNGNLTATEQRADQNTAS